MSNFSRVFGHSVSAVAATAAIVSVLAVGVFPAVSGAAASSADVGVYASSVEPSDTPTASPSATATATSESTKSAFPKVEGWARQPNKVRFHMYPKRGGVAFWTEADHNVASLIWGFDSKALPKGYVDVRSSDEKPKFVKFKKCGIRTRLTVYGFEAAKDHVLPAWPCKYAKKK